MSFFQVIRSEIENVSATIQQQQQVTQGVMDKIQSYPAKIQGAWIGGDADEFAADVARKVIPAITELTAAIGGINLNLSKALGIIDDADTQCQAMASQLGDVFADVEQEALSLAGEVLSGYVKRHRVSNLTSFDRSEDAQK